MTDILSMTEQELRHFLEDNGMKSFRASQIFHYLYKDNIWKWQDMRLLPQKDRDYLQEKAPLYIPEVVSRLEAPDGTLILTMPV